MLLITAWKKLPFLIAVKSNVQLFTLSVSFVYGIDVKPSKLAFLNLKMKDTFLRGWQYYTIMFSLSGLLRWKNPNVSVR